MKKYLYFCIELNYTSEMFDDYNDFEFDDEHKSYDDIIKMPIYQKAKEITETIRQITDLISDDDEMLSSIKSFILSDSMMIGAKIIAAEGGSLYDIRMENAAIIRKCARDLLVQSHSLDLNTTNTTIS